MQTPSGATSDTSVTDLLEDHCDSLGDFATSPRNNLSESPFPAVLASPGDSENSAKENAPTNETARKVHFYTISLTQHNFLADYSHDQCYFFEY